MSRLISILLRVGLVVSAVAAIIGAVRMGLGFVLNLSWYWAGLMAAFAGPVSFALAIYLFERRDGVGKPNA